MHRNTTLTNHTIIAVNVFFFLFLNSAIAQQLSTPFVTNKVIFGGKNNVIAVEAEHFYKQSKSEIRQWFHQTSENTAQNKKDKNKPRFLKGAGNNSYLKILPDTRITHDDKLVVGENFSNEAGKIGVLHYKVQIDSPGRYYVWVRTYSTGSEDNGIHVGIDGTWPASGQRLQWTEGKNSWYWDSKQRTKEIHSGIPHQIYLDIDKKGVHDIQFSMREDGFQFDQFLLTKDKNYIPNGVKALPNVVSGKLKNLANTIAINEELTKKQEAKAAKITGELKKWHKVTLTFDGPETSETDSLNPFMHYYLDVTFVHRDTDQQYTIPGYFAADGNAAETSATKGNKWRVHFAPDQIGKWRYKATFRKGDFVALAHTTRIPQSGNFMDGAEGSFTIMQSDKTGRDFRGKGRLQYVGERYLKFAETGEYFLKVGPDAPENFLSYIDFDGTFHNDGHKDELIKTWEAHRKHWKTGDPFWKKEKGKAMIGAVNYLADKGMNVFSFLTFNIDGDDQNVFPFIDYDTWDRYDVSKLDQWEKIFEHADKLGMFLHFKLSETENQGLLDNGAIGKNTRLYYRELIARFGHHLALNWNIGEENGEWGIYFKTLPMNTAQRLAAARALHELDPYDHHIVIHNGTAFTDVLGKESHITGPSIQTHKSDFRLVHGEVLKWLKKSKKAGKQWAVSVDEPGDAIDALLPDAENPNHDAARQNGLWGAFMAGAWGTEWYFGYKHAHSDLTCQDYTSRDLFWDQCRYLLDFFKNNNVPFWETENKDELVNKDDYCLAKTDAFYIVYLKKGVGSINLEKSTGSYTVAWYNPRKGGALQNGEAKTVTGGKVIMLENAPSEKTQDWVVLLKRN